jgi:hypothetical protein
LDYGRDDPYGCDDAFHKTISKVVFENNYDSTKVF